MDVSHKFFHSNKSFVLVDTTDHLEGYFPVRRSRVFILVTMNNSSLFLEGNRTNERDDCLYCSWVEITGFPVLLCISTFGNLFLLVVVRKSLQSNGSLYVATMAIADLAIM